MTNDPGIPDGSPVTDEDRAHGYTAADVSLFGEIIDRAARDQAHLDALADVFRDPVAPSNAGCSRAACTGTTTRRLYGQPVCEACEPVRCVVPDERFGPGHRPMRKP